MSPRRRTATSNFGVGARESHDATAFYARFRPPELSADDTVLPPRPVAEPFVHGDARHMDAIADGSVALVVTSPAVLRRQAVRGGARARRGPVLVPRVPRRC